MKQELTSTREFRTRAVTTSDRARAGGWARAVLNLDSLVYGFGSWTIGYWAALAFGLGWAFALGFGVVAGGCIVLLARRWPVPHFDTSTERADVVPLAVVLAIVLLWPIALDVGRGAVVVIGIAMLLLRALLPVLNRRFDLADIRLLAVCAIAAAAALAFSWSWTAFVAVCCVVAIGTIARPQWSRWFSDPEDDGAPTAPAADASMPLLRRVKPALASAVILGALGVLFGVWHVSGAFFWNADNTYYLNKALHYADSPTSFPIQDYLFGFDGATHYPMGDVMSAFEPLLGTISALSGISVETLLFQLVIPLSMFLMPFAVRYAARGLGLRRAGLVAGVAAAATLLMTGTEAPTLFAQASLGRTIGRMVLLPIVLGAVAHLLRRKDPGSAMRATLACVCAVGSSPSMTFATALIVAPFTAAGLWELRPTRAAPWRSRLPALVCVSAPAAFVGVYALVAHFIQESAGPSQFLAGRAFPEPIDAWEYTIGNSDRWALTLFFVAGAVAVFPLLLQSSRYRRAGALLIILVLGIVLAPWSFEPLVDDLLDLNYFAARFLWAIPVGLFIGIAVANMDTRKSIGLLTIAVATIGLGLSGPEDVAALRLFSIDADVRDAPTEWPWDARIPVDLRRAAAAIVAATPEGGRFLAPPLVEGVATATQIDRFPVYAREHYVSAVGRAESVPGGFFVEERELLSRGMAGEEKDVPTNRWREALDRVDVDTVCMDSATAPGLRQAVREAYADHGSAGSCRVWTRRS